ncbi:hypothetical protein GCM10011349_44420 [Novosphingobium indicum]|uniref:Copper resistance protein D domain-containing protein n=1 Tax=Novosphingobium indicum TaxID=462949 RepID=A0ABQ2JZK0_9SPHN|nr:hypothetical protein GCM10011349_44420 [Novosphingobium indicum]
MLVTDLVAARAASYLALLLAAGLPLYSLSMGTSRLSGSLRLVLSGLAALAVVTSWWWGWVSVAVMAGLKPSAVDGATFSAVLAATPLGWVLESRTLVLVLFVLAAFTLPARLRLPVMALCGGVALVTASWTGHAGAGEGAAGLGRRLADGAHLLAAATWLGALASLLFGQFRTEPERQFRDLRGFARTGTLVVLVLVVTGLAGTLSIVGLPVAPEALGSLWSVLLVVKLSVFMLMLGLAASNRWRLVPALEAGIPGAEHRLRRSLMLESLAGFVVVALVAVLGTLAPGG